VVDPDLTALAAELAVRFPEAQPVAPLKVLGSGFGSLVLETSGGVVFKVARSRLVSERFDWEASLLREIAALVPVRVPEPRWRAASVPGAPYGIVGYEKLPGAPLAAVPLTGEPARTLGVQIGRFLAALHALRPSELATALPTFDPNVLLTPVFVADARDLLRTHVTTAELRLLDESFERLRRVGADDGDSFVLTHGDLWYENLLVSSGSRLSGVLDWSSAGRSHRARDFAPLTYNGPEFLEAVARAYAEVSGCDAAELLTQVPPILVLRELLGLQWAQEHDNGEVTDATGKVVALLRSSIPHQVT
jgi:aminoglycoside phosphotransferase (APT) family kinase protein